VTDETANLVLEQLRILRGETASLREDTNRNFATMNDRVQGLETQTQGLVYVVTSAVGSLAVDMKDLGARVARLEGGTGLP